MYVMTYMNAVILGYGLFETLEAAELWKKTYVTVGNNADYFVPQLIPVNRTNTSMILLPKGVDFKYSNPR